MMKEFHVSMDELARLDADAPGVKDFETILKNYQRVKKDFAKGPGA